MGLTVCPLSCTVTLMITGTLALSEFPPHLILVRNLSVPVLSFLGKNVTVPFSFIATMPPFWLGDAQTLSSIYLHQDLFITYIAISTGLFTSVFILSSLASGGLFNDRLGSCRYRLLYLNPIFHVYNEIVRSRKVVYQRPRVLALPKMSISDIWTILLAEPTWL